MLERNWNVQNDLVFIKGRRTFAKRKQPGIPHQAGAFHRSGKPGRRMLCLQAAGAAYIVWWFVTAHMPGFFELKNLYDTALAAGFADLEYNASEAGNPCRGGVLMVRCNL